MKAMVLGEGGVTAEERPVPEPGADQVLVAVRACGLNRADLLVARGGRHGFAGGAGAVAGMEWSGDVLAVGDNVTEVAVGDRVMCAGTGGWAEQAVADRGRVIPIPDRNMSYEMAATLPVALATMHDAVVTHGRVAEGQAVLIQGASSGVGLMAQQIARLKGARLVIGTSTDAARRARLGEFGADLAVDTRAEDWVERILEATGGEGVDLSVDQVSGALANGTMRATRILGRVINVGRLGGMSADFDFDQHALRRIAYVGVTFRTRTVEEVRDINRRLLADLGPALEDGRLALPIDRTFALDEAAAALDHMAANAHFGKIVLVV